MQEKNSRFHQYFDFATVDIKALGQENHKDSSRSKIQQLSKSDYITAVKGFFQNTTGAKSFNTRVSGPFNTRIAYLPTMTNSDKSRMTLVKTFAYDLMRDASAAFNYYNDDSIEFSENTRNLIFDNIIMGELDRILDFKFNVKKTNIKDYDKGAVRFNAIPALNILYSTKKTNKMNFMKKFDQYMKENPNITEQEMKSKLVADFKDIFLDYMENSIFEEAQKTMHIGHNSVNYLNSYDKLNDLNGLFIETVAQVDFIINSMIAQTNIMQMYSGDPALYYKDLKGADITKIEGQIALSKAMADNQGKRMAFMIAPGIVPANAENSTYKQLFLNNVVEPSSNIETLIETFYGKQALKTKDKKTNKTYVELLKDYYDGKDTEGEFENILKTRFPKVKDYFNIETTDAQEYTTLEEHLYVLESYGRISPKYINMMK